MASFHTELIAKVEAKNRSVMYSLDGMLWVYFSSYDWSKMIRIIQWQRIAIYDSDQPTMNDFKHWNNNCKGVAKQVTAQKFIEIGSTRLLFISYHLQ